MDIYFLTNSIMNSYRITQKLKDTNEINLDEYIRLFNPLSNSLNNQSSYSIQAGGDDDEPGSFKYYVKLFLKIFAWLIFICFFGPLFPWVLLTFYTFKRLIMGYKIYFRQY